MKTRLKLEYAALFFLNLFTKLPLAAILDDRKSLSITFLSISDQCATFIFFEFFSQNGCQWPFWMTENHFQSHFSPFQINTQFFFHKMATGGHFGLSKITFDYISHHIRSIHNFFFKLFFFQNGRRRPFWKSDLRQK